MSAKKTAAQLEVHIIQEKLKGNGKAEQGIAIVGSGNPSNVIADLAQVELSPAARRFLAAGVRNCGVAELCVGSTRVTACVAD